MTVLFIRWLVLTAAIIIASHLVQGIRVSDLTASFFAAALLGLLNVSLRPLLILFTLPLNILSLGLLTFVINALMLELVSAIIPGFAVYGFWAAVAGSLIISVVSWLLNRFVRNLGTGNGPDDPDCIDMRPGKGGRWE